MRRFSRTRHYGAVVLGAVLLTLPAAWAAGEARAQAGALLAPTPLILKDGRIANVSVHMLEFRQGADELGFEASAELRELTRETATDCFLTAQVIGHVGLAEISANDTLGAHRLARSRADAVQAALVGGGLPAGAIASVWDWQFMVREPRATVWLFRLIRGEDCEGTPLQPEEPALVASADNDPAPAGTDAGAAPTSDAAEPTRERTEAAGRAASDGAGRERLALAQAKRAPRAEPATATAGSDGDQAEDAEAAKEQRSPRVPAEARQPAPEMDADGKAAPDAEQRTESAAADGRADRAEPERPAAAEAASKAPARAVAAEATGSRATAEQAGSAAGAARSGADGANSARGELRPQKKEAGAAGREPEPRPERSTGSRGREPDQKEAATTRQEDPDPQPSATAREGEPAQSAAPTSEPERATAKERRTRSQGEASGALERRAPSGVPTVIQPLPALSPKPSEPSERSEAPRDATTRPAQQSPTSVVATAEAAQPAEDARSSGPVLVITFANNSSYFPSDAAGELRALIRELEPGQRYRVRLLGAISGSDKVVGASSPEEAERYNKWLTTRRIERVESWLAENATDAELAIEPEFLPENNSRQVTVRITPAG